MQREKIDFGGVCKSLIIRKNVNKVNVFEFQQNKICCYVPDALRTAHYVQVLLFKNKIK